MDSETIAVAMWICCSERHSINIQIENQGNTGWKNENKRKSADTCIPLLAM
jgi:hypothetical protein